MRKELWVDYIRDESPAVMTNGASMPDQLPVMMFPSLFHAVDKAAADAQRQLLGIRSTELVSLVIAASLAALPRTLLGGIGPILGLASFVLALALRLSGADVAAERRWYDGRAAAESIKSMSWQYAVGGESYRLGDADSNARFVENMLAILGELHHLDIPVANSHDAAVPSEMSTLRASSRAQRIAAYSSLRVQDQLDWYRRKAAWNKVRARQWRTAMMAIEAGGVALGLFRALGWYDVDLLGILAALAASCAAWQQTKNFQGLSQAYAVTSHDVALVYTAMGTDGTEQAWAQAVHDAEAAFSREHTMWRARRQGPTG